MPSTATPHEAPAVSRMLGLQFRTSFFLCLLVLWVFFLFFPPYMAGTGKFSTFYINVHRRKPRDGSRPPNTPCCLKQHRKSKISKKKSKACSYLPWNER